MSSQTTDTPGTTTTTIPVEDRSGATFQTYPVTRSFANQRFRDYQSHTTGPHPKSARKFANHFPGRLEGGRSLSFRFSGGDSNYFTHQPDPEQIDPQGCLMASYSPGLRGLRPPRRPLHGQAADVGLLWIGSHPGRGPKLGHPIQGVD